MKNIVLLTILLAIAASLGWRAQALSNDAFSTALGSPAASTLRQNIPNRLGDSWKPLAEADFDRDGNLDVLFQDPAGALQVQLMERNVVQLAVMIREGKAPAKGWKPIAAADFNGDNFADILFQHPDGRLAIWWLKGASFLRAEEITLATATR